jgi:hypothetical protein
MLLTPICVAGVIGHDSPGPGESEKIGPSLLPVIPICNHDVNLSSTSCTRGGIMKDLHYIS